MPHRDELRANVRLPHPHSLRIDLVPATFVYDLDQTREDLAEARTALSAVLGGMIGIGINWLTVNPLVRPTVVSIVVMFLLFLACGYFWRRVRLLDIRATAARQKLQEVTFEGDTPEDVSYVAALQRKLPQRKSRWDTDPP